MNETWKIALCELCAILETIERSHSLSVVLFFVLGRCRRRYFYIGSLGVLIIQIASNNKIVQ